MVCFGLVWFDLVWFGSALLFFCAATSCVELLDGVLVFVRFFTFLYLFYFICEHIIFYHNFCFILMSCFCLYFVAFFLVFVFFLDHFASGPGMYFPSKANDSNDCRCSLFSLFFLNFS